LIGESQPLETSSPEGRDDTARVRHYIVRALRRARAKRDTGLRTSQHFDGLNLKLILNSRPLTSHSSPRRAAFPGRSVQRYASTNANASHAEDMARQMLCIAASESPLNANANGYVGCRT
jgi:hypothetical protein